MPGDPGVAPPHCLKETCMTTICLSPNGIDEYRLDAPPTRAWVATMNGVVCLSGGVDGPWRTTARGMDGLHVGSLMAEPGTANFHAGTHGQGLYRSLDDGTTWTRAMDGIEHEHIFTLGQRTVDGRVELFAGTEPCHLYRSADHGATWTELRGLRDVPTRGNWNFPAPPHIAHVKHVTCDPRDPRVIYVCIEQGALLKSLDDGATFEELHFQDDSYKLNRDTHRIVFHPDNPDEIYLDGGDGIARSRDAGRTWERIATPAMRVGYPDQLFFSPRNDGTLFVAGGGTPPNIWRQTGNAQAAIARSTDGGRTWSQLGGGLPEEIRGNIEAVTLFSWPDGFGFLAGTTDGEVFGSFDAGEHWRLLAMVEPVSKCVHHRNLSMGRQAAAAAP